VFLTLISITQQAAENLDSRHSGAGQRPEPGIHNPSMSASCRQGLWIPDSRGACHRAALARTRWRLPE